MDSTVPPLRYTFPRSVESPIAVETLPDAACIVSCNGDVDPSRSLKLYSDSHGMIRFHVTLETELDVVTKLVVNCEADGKSSHYYLELRASPEATQDMRTHALVVRKLLKGACVLPPLTGEDHLRLSNRELLEKGYPSQPDPQKEPTAHAAWRKRVSRPITVVKLRPFYRACIGPPDGKAENTSSVPATPSPSTGASNAGYYGKSWSGMGLFPASNPKYTEIFGTWFVPTSKPDPNSADSPQEFSIWVGIDGASDFTNDRLVQAGTAYKTVTNGGVRMSSYYAWTEIWPKEQEKPIAIADIAINPNDEVSVDVAVGNLVGGVFEEGLPATVAKFNFQVIHDGNTIIYQVPPRPLSGCDMPVNPLCKPSEPVNFQGSNAQWILERTIFSADASHPDGLFALPQYDSFQMIELLVSTGRPGGLSGLVNRNPSTGVSTIADGLVDYIMTSNGARAGGTVLSRSHFYLGEDGQPTNSIIFNWHPSS